MPAPSRLDLLYPEVGKWGAPNDLRISALLTTQVDKTSYVALEDTFWCALVYDTSVSKVPRFEPILSFPGKGAEMVLTLYAPWEGTYVPRGRFGTPPLVPKTAMSLVYPHIVIQLRRNKPLISGCPFLLQVSYGALAYTFPFGVGPEAAYGWPRDLENVRIPGQDLPPPLDRLARHFQTVDRNEYRLPNSAHRIDMNTSGVDSGSEDGQVLGGTVLSEAMVVTDRKIIDISDPTTWGDP